MIVIETHANEAIVAYNQSKNPGIDIQNNDDLPTPAPEGSDLGKSEAARVPPESKTGSDTRASTVGGATVGGPGGPDTGSNAMPGQSNAL